MIKPCFINTDSTIQRKQYVAPAMLVETFVEEGEMLAATPFEVEKPPVESGEGDEDYAKQNNLFFDDNGLDW